MKKYLFSKPMKFIYGILLLPLCFSTFLSLVYVIKNIEYPHNTVLMFILGAIVYLAIHLLLYQPIKIYVYGHELVHMISTILCGGKVKNLKIGKKSGSVSVSKMNSFITLSPYFVPIYSLITIILWSILKYIFKLQIKPEILTFFLGFTLMFHLIYTLYAVYVGQTDFNISGWLFSLVIIFIMNCIIISILFIFILPAKVGSKETLYYWHNETIKVYKIVYSQLVEKSQSLIKIIKEKWITSS